MCPGVANRSEPRQNRYVSHSENITTRKVRKTKKKRTLCADAHRMAHPHAPSRIWICTSARPFVSYQYHQATTRPAVRLPSSAFSLSLAHPYKVHLVVRGPHGLTHAVLRSPPHALLTRGGRMPSALIHYALQKKGVDGRKHAVSSSLMAGLSGLPSRGFGGCREMIGGLINAK